MAVAQDKRASELTAPVSIEDTDTFPGYRPGTGGEPNLDIRASAGLIRAPILAGLAAGDVEVGAGGVVLPAANVGTNSRSRTYAGKARDVPHLFDWISDTSHATIQARTNTNDLSTNIADAISDMSGNTAGGSLGGVILVPYGTFYCANVEMKSRVYLEGPAWGPATPGATFIASDDGSILQVTAGSVTGLGVKGIRFQSDYTAYQCVGIDCGDSNNFNIDSSTFDGFYYEAIKQSGLTTRISRCFTSNCLMERSTALSSGAIKIAGTDCWIESNEIGCGVASAAGTLANNNRVAAVYCTGSNNWFANNLLENAALGYNFTAASMRNQIIGGRVDLMQHYGIADAGADNDWINVRTHNVSLYANAAAPAILGQAARSKYIGCANTGDLDALRKPSYGFQENNTPSTVADIPEVVGFKSNWHATADKIITYARVDGFHRKWTQSISAGVVPLAHGMAVHLAPGSATNATSFSNGGQMVVITTDGNVTFVNSATLITSTGADYTPDSGKSTIWFRESSTAWRAHLSA